MSSPSYRTVFPGRPNYIEQASGMTSVLLLVLTCHHTKTDALVILPSHTWQHLTISCTTIATPEQHKLKKSLTEAPVFHFDDTIVVIYIRAPVGTARKFERHTVIHNKDRKRFVHGWPKEIGIAKKYWRNQYEFFTCIRSSNTFGTTTLGVATQTSIESNYLNLQPDRNPPSLITKFQNPRILASHDR